MDWFAAVRECSFAHPLPTRPGRALERGGKDLNQLGGDVIRSVIGSSTTRQRCSTVASKLDGVYGVVNRIYSAERRELTR
jgi:hypothetical protein